MSNIDWNMVSAIATILSLVLMLLVDWDNIASRLQISFLARLATRISHAVNTFKRHWKTIGLLLGLLILEYVQSQLSVWSVILFALQLLLLLGLVFKIIATTTSFVLVYDFIDEFGEATVINSAEHETHKVRPVERALSRRPAGTEMRAIWAHPGYPDKDTEVTYQLPVKFAAAQQLTLMFAVAILGKHPLEERNCRFEDKRDNSVKFEVRVNGKTVFERVFRASDPGLYKWEQHAITVIPAMETKGETLKVGLITNAMGQSNYNWTAWGEPKLIAKFHVPRLDAVHPRR